MNNLDTNGDGQIDVHDGLDQSYVDDLNSLCDYDNDGSTDICEAH